MRDEKVVDIDSEDLIAIQQIALALIADFLSKETRIFY